MPTVAVDGFHRNKGTKQQTAISHNSKTTNNSRKDNNNYKTNHNNNNTATNSTCDEATAWVASTVVVGSCDWQSF